MRFHQDNFKHKYGIYCIFKLNKGSRITIFIGLWLVWYTICLTAIQPKWHADSFSRLKRHWPNYIITPGVWVSCKQTPRVLILQYNHLRFLNWRNWPLQVYFLSILLVEICHMHYMWPLYNKKFIIINSSAMHVTNFVNKIGKKILREVNFAN